VRNVRVATFFCPDFLVDVGISLKLSRSAAKEKLSFAISAGDLQDVIALTAALKKSVWLAVTPRVVRWKKTVANLTSKNSQTQ